MDFSRCSVSAQMIHSRTKYDCQWKKCHSTSQLSMLFSIALLVCMLPQADHELWGYVDGFEKKPDSTKPAELKIWNKNNAKVMSWIVGSVAPQIGTNLREYQTAVDMWKYLQKLYLQQNDARKFQLKIEIVECSQGDKTLQKYYSVFTNLWLEYNSLVSVGVPTASLSVVQGLQEKDMRVSCLQKSQLFVSSSSFYNSTITPCPSGSCGCRNINDCILSNSKRLNAVGINTPRKDNSPLLQCTHQMCPVRVHWHVKLNYKDYWRVKIAITNFNYRMNYTQWTLVVQHPSLNNVSFDYKPLVSYQSINDTGMFYGMKFYNDLLMEAGPAGSVQSEVFLQKDMNTFSFKQAWEIPRKVYFNGDECVLPPPDAYPHLPSSAESY